MGGERADADHDVAELVERVTIADEAAFLPHDHHFSEELQALLKYQMRARNSSFTKNLLSLPFMAASRDGAVVSSDKEPWRQAKEELRVSLSAHNALRLPLKSRR